MGLFGLGKSENLYFPGCFSYAFLENKIENYRKILKKLDIDFKLSKDYCCGGILDELGYEKELRKLAKENNEKFSDSVLKKIITSCPLCCNTLANYKSQTPDFNVQVEFILVTILNKIQDNRHLVKNYFADSIAYYDACYPARYLNTISEPRELLGYLGYKVIELPYNKEETLCAGSCGCLSENNPELAEKIVVKFVKMLQRKNIKKLVTADPRAYVHLKNILAKLNISSEEIQIIEFSDIICDGLGIKKE
jgi:Fe-S oxidoreductase